MLPLFSIRNRPQLFSLRTVKPSDAGDGDGDGDDDGDGDGDGDGAGWMIAPFSE
jgi:hypothetical protein